MHRRRRLFSFLFVAAITALGIAACSGESEGQRCDLTDDPGGPNNSAGSSDCAGNLVCYPAATLGGQAATWANGNSNFGICCPLNRDTSTTSVCAYQPSPPGGDAAAPADAATDGEATDASTDAASDAPGATSDAGDASGDASDDGATTDGAGTSSG